MAEYLQIRFVAQVFGVLEHGAGSATVSEDPGAARSAIDTYLVSKMVRDRSRELHLGFPETISTTRMRSPIFYWCKLRFFFFYVAE
jgi:hypothetical protein